VEAGNTSSVSGFRIKSLLGKSHISYSSQLVFSLLLYNSLCEWFLKEPTGIDGGASLSLQ
jgi:hypothetical protein